MLQDRFPDLAIFTRAVLLALLCGYGGGALAKPPMVEIEIRGHLFYPSEVRIPANTKVKLLIKNLDPTAEEFESYELNREKVIAGNTKSVIFIGPLPPGEYPFFGEFFPKTAQGKVIVE